MTIEEIESIEFREFNLGGYSYHLKRVAPNPMQNVINLVKVGDDYYTKQIIPENIKSIRTSTRRNCLYSIAEMFG